ncbi:hypothetical protein CFC21_075335 [Triticum aestivum]|uniref:Uncharacterized protein n=2 Tax=Triticinae TaxID=1648030 RepID=A0A9R1HRG7_WHEAT|nr:uncharacterized protein LOC109770470 [Aegilops tauschii subsp. strangulata]XP_044400666.1 uncharacterized protein LOC123124029 [Triticum aestivum]KAF7069752.1 hypothetical protein CFC21_075335 [Triticum aestivum]
MALNTRNAIVAILLLVVMVAAVSTPAVTAQEDCWDKCFKDCKAKMAMEVCNQKCIDFCIYQAGAREYVKMAGDKLKETKTASPEQATILKNQATTYLERAKVLSDKAVTP